jgi:uncharacterized membrane protein YkvA (DUF1232 family)
MSESISTGWTARARQLKTLIHALLIAWRDPRTPLPAKLVAACVLGYAFSPIDLIPDFIPLLGYLDDLVLIPLGVALTIRLIPAQVWTDAQSAAAVAHRDGASLGRVAGGVIVTIWLALAVAAILLLRRWL